jgi:hypothetical protein
MHLYTYPRFVQKNIFCVLGLFLNTLLIFDFCSFLVLEANMAASTQYFSLVA